MIEIYRLIEDSVRKEWRLLKHEAKYAESIFLTLEDAIKRLPDAVGNISAVVEVYNAEGLNCGQHVINRHHRSSAQTFN